MLNPKMFDEIVNRLTAIVPPSLQHLRNDLEQHFRGILQSSLLKLDLVTREEFDAQVNVLARSRAKIEALEKQIAVLEQHLLKNDNNPLS